MDNKLHWMKQTVQKLNEAGKAYYQENREIMPNIEYDRLYDELIEAERETGIVMSNSPTIRVGYELLTHLPKEYHEKPMLSLAKTKDIQTLKDWLGEQKGITSWKLDGLTIVLTYYGGKLVKAVTRGNGEVGEVITNNVRVFKNIPLGIPYMGNLVLRGEAVISYSDFKRINQGIENVDAKYKNPRNLCSGSVRQLNNQITSERNVYFFAFAIVKAENVGFENSREVQLRWLKRQGFDIVPFRVVELSTLEETVTWFSEQIDKNNFPADGLVLAYDDIRFGESLGATAKFPRDSMAFKWLDEIRETTLRKIEWSASRTGLINPIAVFKPVELEGTTVSRASVHNISVMESLELGIGDTIGVYKANMIIPQIAHNLTKSGSVKTPEKCPVCQGETQVQKENGVKVLFCINPNCLAKQIKAFTHFVGRDAMGIDGLSEATIEKFIAKGMIKKPADIYHLRAHKERIIEMEGFGEKSYSKLMDAIDRSRKTNVIRFLYSLGIPNVGLSNARIICREFEYDWLRIEKASYEDLVEIKGIGEVMAKEYTRFFSDVEKRTMIHSLLEEIEFEKIEGSKEPGIFENIQFVITGSVSQFKNRNALKQAIESRGGKTTQSVTSKTDFLINNDTQSNSSKNKKAKELGVRIISESQFIEWVDHGIHPEA